MVKVSIVIPVYNRKNFLTVCIKSLLAQSFEDFEICLVEDGSTDGTGLLCDELAEKDSRSGYCMCKKEEQPRRVKKGWNWQQENGSALSTLMIPCLPMLCNVCFRRPRKIRIL